jgi:hypothetical protein
MVLVVVLGTVLGPPAAAQDIVPAPIPRKGADVSWPNCPKGMGIKSRRTQGLPMPKPHARFVVIGLTNGPGFYPNPCIARQVRWAKDRGMYVGVYAMTTYPSPTQLRRHASTGPWSDGTRMDRLRNAGYAQARFNLATMQRVGLSNTFVWVDIEPYPVAAWTTRRDRNRAVVAGVLRGYRDAGMDVGFYTSPNSWRSIIGDTRYGIPEWRTAGGHPWSRTSYAHARRMCRASSVQGGSVLMAQWWDTKRDYDLLCGRARTRETVDNIFTWMEEGP